MATVVWAERISAGVVVPNPSSSCRVSLPSVDGQCPRFACAGRVDPTFGFDSSTFPNLSPSVRSSSSWGFNLGKGAGSVSLSHGKAVSCLWQRSSGMGGHGGTSGAWAATAAAGGYDHGPLQLGLNVHGAGQAATPHYHYSLRRRRCSTRRTVDGGEGTNAGSNGSGNRGSEEGISGEPKDGEKAMDDWRALAAEDEEDVDEKIEKENEDGGNVAKKNGRKEKVSWSWRGWWASPPVLKEEKLIQETEGEVEKEREEEGGVDGEDVERAGGDPEIVAAAADAESEEGGDGLEEQEEATIRSSKAKGVPKKGEEASVGFWERVLFWKRSVEGDEEEELEPEEELLLQDLESLSFNWREVFDPTWENLLALGLTALLAVGLFKFFMQLVGVVLTIVLEGLKYTLLASIVVGLLIFFL